MKKIYFIPWLLLILPILAMAADNAPHIQRRDVLLYADMLRENVRFILENTDLISAKELKIEKNGYVNTPEMNTRIKEVVSDLLTNIEHIHNARVAVPPKSEAETQKLLEHGRTSVLDLLYFISSTNSQFMKRKDINSGIGVSAGLAVTTLIGSGVIFYSALAHSHFSGSWHLEPYAIIALPVISSVMMLMASMTVQDFLHQSALQRNLSQVIDQTLVERLQLTPSELKFIKKEWISTLNSCQWYLTK